MIIYSNEGNPFGLKLLISSKFGDCSGDALQIKKVSLNDISYDIKHLPTLELKSGKQIFSSNVAAKFLYPNNSPDNDGSINQWLEWSVSRLAPALQQNATKTSNSDDRIILKQLLDQLNDTLNKSLYVTGPQITVADISIWTLLMTDSATKGFQDIDSLLIWCKTIENLPQVQSSLTEFPIKDLHFNSVQNSNRFGGLNHISVKISICDEISGNDVEVEIGGDEQQQQQQQEIVSQDEINLAKQRFLYKPLVVEKEPRTVLPIAGRKNVLITSALPYVNNVPHLGNIIGCVLSADIFARYSRLVGYNTLYVCGTDEYGTATEAKALAENLTPKQICDKYFEIHNSIYRWFGIGFDYFGRTSTPEQTQIVQEMFMGIKDGGYTINETVDQLLCTKCNRYLADRFVEGTCPHLGCGYEDARGDQCDGCGKLVNAIDLIKPRCSVCRTTPEVRQSQQFFIDLPKIEPKLRTWFESVESGWTNNSRVITKSWLREGLRPRCITRDLKWGIPVPVAGFESKVFYVWFDAPIGYVSITARYTPEWRQWWQPKAADGVKVDLYQFMAKDNVPFHAVMFPSTLLALDQGYTIVSHLMATEYLNYEDGKFSKSRGIGVFGNDAQDTGISADVWRFYLASSRPEGQDSNFSWSDLITRNNSELLNNLGNFINRSLVFCENNFGNIVPEIQLNSDELNLLALVNRELKEYIESMERSKFRYGLHCILTISKYGNQYLQTAAPWKLAKGTDEEKLYAGTVIALCCNLCCLLANMLFPFMPDTSRQIYNQLNTKPWKINVEQPQIQQYFQAGHKIGKPSPLFTKIEPSRLAEFQAKYGGKQQKSVASESLPAITTVADAEKAITEQGEKVRTLKASGVEKAIWQPEVEILLKLKKQLAKLSNAVDGGASAAPASAVKTTAPAKKTKIDVKSGQVLKTVADAEKAVTAQGEKVRTLKASKVEKSVWQPEVDILLKLKKQLAELSSAGGADEAADAEAAAIASIARDLADFKTIADAEKAIAAQGEKVRTLKASKVEKSVWQPEVEILLKLKKQLVKLTASGGKK